MNRQQLNNTEYRMIRYRFFRHLLLITLTSSLLACGAVDTFKDGMSHANATANQLEQSLGIKPEVGFHWSNGTLNSVTVSFARIPAPLDMAKIEAESKRIILQEFKQKPKQIVFVFTTTP